MRPHLFLALWAVLVLVIGATVVASDRLDLGGGGADQVIGGPDGVVTSTTAPTIVVPGPGQVRVSGTLSTLRLDGALLQPRLLATPLTITANRGFGNGAELTGISVDGKPSTIVWDGGRPFALFGGAGIIPDPLIVELGSDGLRVTLGRSAHRLEPGTYRLDTPVGVGTSGIATPRDSVIFDATDESMLAARGDAAVMLSPSSPHRFLGPGRVDLRGFLDLTDADGTRQAPSYEVDVAAYDLTIEPDGSGGWTIEGLVDSSRAP